MLLTTFKLLLLLDVGVQRSRNERRRVSVSSWRSSLPRRDEILLVLSNQDVEFRLFSQSGRMPKYETLLVEGNHSHFYFTVLSPVLGRKECEGQTRLVCP